LPIVLNCVRLVQYSLRALWDPVDGRIYIVQQSKLSNVCWHTPNAYANTSLLYTRNNKLTITTTKLQRGEVVVAHNDIVGKMTYYVHRRNRASCDEVNYLSWYKCKKNFSF